MGTLFALLKKTAQENRSRIFGAMPLPRPQILHSNISCTKDVGEYFDKLHDQREFRYVTWKIRSGTKEKIVALEKTGHRDADFIDITPEWGYKDALLFIYWSPFEGSNNESRTVYAATKHLVLNTLRRGTSLKSVEVTDMDDLTEPKLMSILMPYREKGVDLHLFKGSRSASQSVEIN